jgi:hypothetical protein
MEKGKGWVAPDPVKQVEGKLVKTFHIPIFMAGNGIGKGVRGRELVVLKYPLAGSQVETHVRIVDAVGSEKNEQ